MIDFDERIQIDRDQMKAFIERNMITYIYIYVIYPHYIHICNEQKTYALYVEFEDRHSNRKQTYFK